MDQFKQLFFDHYGYLPLAVLSDEEETKFEVVVERSIRSLEVQHG